MQVSFDSFVNNLMLGKKKSFLKDGPGKSLFYKVILVLEKVLFARWFVPGKSPCKVVLVLEKSFLQGDFGPGKHHFCKGVLVLEKALFCKLGGLVLER